MRQFMGRRSIRLSGLSLPMCLIVMVVSVCSTQSETHPGPAGLEQVEHLVVIYQENRSFNHLFGFLPGVNGIKQAEAEGKITQIDESGKPYTTLPPIFMPFGFADPRFPTDLAAKPFDMLPSAPIDSPTGVPTHRFYQNQMQINGGKNDKFVVFGDYPRPSGLPLGYYDVSSLSLGKLAQEFTVCDNFFQAAFGGSFLNHQWLISATTPVWPDAPEDIRAQLDENGKLVKDGQVTPDGYAVNTVFSVNVPHPPPPDPSQLPLPPNCISKDCEIPSDPLLPSQTHPTIGDRLSEKKVSWAWYAQGWTLALTFFENKMELPGFVYYHQPFVYFENYAEGKPGRQHLQDLENFEDGVRNNRLPAVSFVKLMAPNSEHPGQFGLQPGVDRVVGIVEAIRNSGLWKKTAIIITYDENGGYWDHVAPPAGDRWGPSNRVPTVVVSPFAKKTFVDSTVYDTTSILKLIETRWQLKPLSDRDAKANNLLNAFDFSAKP